MDVLKYKEYEVEILCDSRANGHRLTTFRLVFPRIVLAEFNTHRLVSRNSASSRAIPVLKMVQYVLDHPFIPDRFPKTHSGMQASVWVEEGSGEYELLKDEWLYARDIAVDEVKKLTDLEISKQLANRILEPFLMHQVIATATEWENFLSLRANEAAQNEIQIPAKMMLEALNTSCPKHLEGGQWHVPFGDKLDQDRLHALLFKRKEEKPNESLEDLSYKISVARCARVSYRDFNGKDDYEADVNLFDRLTRDGHWSPFEHVARAMEKWEYKQYTHCSPAGIELGWCGNFRGFIQYRKMFPQEVENRREPRLKHMA